MSVGCTKFNSCAFSTLLAASDDTKEQDLALVSHAPSKISFGSNNEHVACEKLLLKTLIDEQRWQELNASATSDLGLRALMICEGADNFMSILSDLAVETVVVVDQHPFQLALAQLKLALACSSLETREIVSFLGMKRRQRAREESPQHDKNILDPELPLAVAKAIHEIFMHEVEEGIATFR
eukprot:CAMPEP_0113578568 /NCGR_PEP_ID=MMETSP0015_2-20120614/29562_1 /TAXON_ID=2838 /ORGANISM="Odontella" /LENGTH=181 /DNA_ID=CAMNT_0000482405 /DNA_START=303 /DNA_END=846 /DNA_ORIENTATION=+ /assembly_acc=CAM_ASM_000160